VVFRLHGDEFVFGGSVHPVQPTIPQMKMMKVHIPFTFKIQESSKSSYNGESKKNFTLLSTFDALISVASLFLPGGSQNFLRFPASVLFRDKQLEILHLS